MFRNNWLLSFILRYFLFARLNAVSICSRVIGNDRREDSCQKAEQIFEKECTTFSLSHLQALFSLQVSAKLWHVGISAPSTRCAHGGCTFSCATMHSSFLPSVFLRHKKKYTLQRCNIAEWQAVFCIVCDDISY